MYEQSPEPSATAPVRTPLTAQPAERANPLAPVAIWAAVTLVACGIGLYFWHVEGELARIPYATAVTFTIAAAIVCASRSALVAAILTIAVLGMVHAVSY